MAEYKFDLPDVGEGIAEVEICEWQVAVGDTIAEDDLLCVVLTDKAAVEIPSPVDGRVIWIGPEAGSTMAVGSQLVVIEAAGEDGVGDAEPARASAPDKALSAETAVEKPVETPAETQASAPEAQSSPDAFARGTAPQSHTEARQARQQRAAERPLASPAVRQRARDLGLALHAVPGSGPGGRITHDDLDSWLARLRGGSTSGPQTTPDTRVERIKVTGLRRKIGAILQDTMQRIPHYSYVEEVDVTELESLRQRLNQNRRDGQPKLTLLPFIMRALVLALRVYPQMASRYDDQTQELEQHAAAHIGIATQTDAGLLVPVVRQAQSLDLWQTAARLLTLAEKARSGKATREELGGSTITITSLGPQGGIVTTPVINAPEVAIVGINKIATRPVWQQGAFVPRQIMNLSSSFDHRIIDGWEATQFIQELKQRLESPALLFLNNPEGDRP